MAVLLRNVTKRYGNYEAVRGSALRSSIRCGAGRSVRLRQDTTLRMIAGLEDVSEGDICIGGRHQRHRAEEPRHRHGISRAMRCIRT